jgi:hypothetical protein
MQNTFQFIERVDKMRSSIILFEKHFNKDPYFDYFKVFLLLPDIAFRRKERECLIDIQRVTCLIFETAIEYVKHPIFWSFKIRILGFGFELVRQNGY